MTLQGKRRVWMMLGALAASGAYAAAALKLPITLGLSTGWVEIACQVLAGIGSGIVGAGAVKTVLICSDKCYGTSLDLSEEVSVELAEQKNALSSRAFLSKIGNGSALSEKEQAIYYNALATKYHNAQKANDSQLMHQCSHEADTKLNSWMNNQSDVMYLAALQKNGYKYSQLPSTLFSPVSAEEDEDDRYEGVDFSQVNQTRKLHGSSYIHIATTNNNAKAKL